LQFQIFLINHINPAFQICNDRLLILHISLVVFSLSHSLQVGLLELPDPVPETFHFLFATHCDILWTLLISQGCFCQFLYLRFVYPNFILKASQLDLVIRPACLLFFGQLFCWTLGFTLHLKLQLELFNPNRELHYLLIFVLQLALQLTVTPKEFVVLQLEGVVQRMASGRLLVLSWFGSVHTRKRTFLLVETFAFLHFWSEISLGTMLLLLLSGIIWWVTRSQSFMAASVGSIWRRFHLAILLDVLPAPCREVVVFKFDLLLVGRSLSSLFRFLFRPFDIDLHTVEQSYVWILHCKLPCEPLAPDTFS